MLCYGWKELFEGQKELSCQERRQGHFRRKGQLAGPLLVGRAQVGPVAFVQSSLTGSAVEGDFERHVWLAVQALMHHRKSLKQKDEEGEGSRWRSWRAESKVQFLVVESAGLVMGWVWRGGGWRE